MQCICPPVRKIGLSLSRVSWVIGVVNVEFGGRNSTALREVAPMTAAPTLRTCRRQLLNLLIIIIFINAPAAGILSRPALLRNSRQPGFARRPTNLISLKTAYATPPLHLLVLADSRNPTLGSRLLLLDFLEYKSTLPCATILLRLGQNVQFIVGIPTRVGESEYSDDPRSSCRRVCAQSCFALNDIRRGIRLGHINVRQWCIQLRPLCSD